MYSVYLNDDVCILDPKKDLYLDEPVLDLAENSAGSFTFKIYEDNPGYELVQHPMTTFITVKRDDEILWSGRILNYDEDFHKGLRVECEGDLAFLDDSIQEPARYQNYTISGYLEALLNIHNVKVEDAKKIYPGLINVGEPGYSSLYRFTNFESTLTCIKEDLLEDFGGHLRLRYVNGIRYLDYLKDYPRVTNQKIEFGENLLDFTASTTGADLATAVIPVGAVIEDEEFVEGLDKRVTIEEVNDGIRELVIPEAVQRYGKITKTVQFDDVHIASNLKEKGQKWLEDNQFETISLQLTAVDLADFGLHDDHINLLDSVVCTSKPHGMNRQFPVCEMSIHLLDPEQNVYTLGTVTKGYTTDSSRAEKQIKDMVLDIPSESSTLKKAQDYVQQLMNINGKNGHVVYRENEILIMDTTDIDTAKNVWRFNLAGWAHSSNGYEGPFNAATTEDGLIMGEMIVAGSIHSEQISSVYKSSVETAIQDSYSNSTDYTDEQLKSYWTKLETETAIQQSADGIKLYAKQQATDIANGIKSDVEGDIDGKLTLYYTKAEIDLQTDQITQSVESARSYASSLVADARQDFSSSLDQYETSANALQRAQNILSQSKDYTNDYVDKAIEGVVAGQLVNVYTKSEIQQREDEINQSIAQVRDYVQTVENSAAVISTSYYTKSAIDQLLTEITLSVREDMIVHTPNLLRGTQEWDFEGSYANGTLVQTDDVYALELAYTKNTDLDYQVFSLTQNDIDFVQNEFYTLSIDVNSPGSGTFILNIDKPVYNIVDAFSDDSASVTFTDQKAEVRYPLKSGQNKVSVTIQLGNRFISESAWQWDPFNFEQDTIQFFGSTTTVKGLIGSKSSSGTYKIKCLQLDRGKEITAYNAGVCDLTSKYAQVKIDLENINLSVAQVRTYASDQANSALQEAKDYTDTETDAALDSAKADTDKKLKDYYTISQIDIKVGEITTSVESTRTYATEQANSALTSAKSYTDDETDAALDAAKADTDSKLTSYYTKSEINLKEEQINLSVEKKVNSDEVISAINMSPEEIAIQANRIKLEGLVTANKYFEITTAGSCQVRSILVKSGIEIYADNNSSGRTAYIDFHTTDDEDFSNRISSQSGVMWIWDANGSGGQQPGVLQTGKIVHGGLEARSDIRLKKDVYDLDPRQSYDLLMNLQPKTYRLKADWDDRLHHGLIYQDVKKMVNPEWSLIGSLTEADGKEYGALDYTQLIPDLISTIQYQDQRIKDLERRMT